MQGADARSSKRSVISAALRLTACHAPGWTWPAVGASTKMTLPAGANHQVTWAAVLWGHAGWAGAEAPPGTVVPLRLYYY